MPCGGVLRRNWRLAGRHTARNRGGATVSESNYALPMDLRYLFDFLRPILEAFFLTASVFRPSFFATFEVALLGNSLLSRLMSLVLHCPLGPFLFGAFFLAALFLFAIFHPFQKGVGKPVPAAQQDWNRIRVYGRGTGMSRVFGNFMQGKQGKCGAGPGPMGDSRGVCKVLGLRGGLQGGSGGYTERLL